MRPAKPLLLLICLSLLAANAVFAQTDTPTPVLTPTPDVHQYWTLEPETNDLGTPEPEGIGVAFSYSADAGDVAIAILLGMLIFILWGAFVIGILINRRSM